MRLFVAIDVPETLKDAIEADVVEGLRDRLPGARWTRPEGRHLTLKFLGNVDDERVPEIATSVRSAVASHGVFASSFNDIGGFPNLRRPRVLWVGIGDGATQMAALAGDVDRELELLGFVPEGRAFHGHFTLARFPRPQPIAELPAVVVPGDVFEVREVVLFQSQLHQRGARYTALERFELSALR